MRHHVWVHYLTLIGILLGGIAAFLYVYPNTKLQLVAGVVTSSAYVIWGVIHHWMQRDLHPKIVIEYILIGVIAIVLLVTILGI